MMFDIQVLHSITEIDAVKWDRFNRSCPFASHQWYRFGEAAQPEDQPFYILLSKQGELVARAVFWLVRQEPLPIAWMPARRGLQAVFRRWPLLICRTALAHAPGLLLPRDESRQEALATFARAADEIAREHGASAIFFDYLSAGASVSSNWPEGYALMDLDEPGTRLMLDAPDFDAYVSGLGKSARKDYHRHTNRAADLGITIAYHDSAVQAEAALALIRDVEQHHHASPYPNARHLLKHMGMVGGTWITATIGERLVGCGLLVGDGSTQFLTLLGLDYSVNFTYFQLFYAAIRRAIELGVSDLRGGSGAYDFKKRLGFEIEPNDQIALKATNPVLSRVARCFAGA
jgi:predicted N-acyltransferase